MQTDKKINWLFLRGHATALNEPYDMWQSLFMALTGNDYGEMLCFGKPGTYQISQNFNIQCLENINTYNPKSHPDIIFARGGFPDYNKILKRYSQAKKIYYGAGVRYLPNDNIHYDLILMDCHNHQKECKIKLPHIRSELWIKPAHENFIPPSLYTYEYDICYIGNGGASDKGHHFVKTTCPPYLKILHLGRKSEVDTSKNITHKYVERNEMPYWIGKCKIGILPYQSKDSCPRVISEMLACGLPIIAFDSINFWNDKYKDVVVVSKKEFWNNVIKILNTKINHNKISENYKKTLSINASVEYLKKLMSTTHD